MGSSDSVEVLSMGPYFVYGIEVACIGIQIRGPLHGPLGEPFWTDSAMRFWAAYWAPGGRC